jgi:ketosteroid isomerase-like protein
MIITAVGGDPLSPDDLISLSGHIQKAFDTKDIDAILQHYHDDIVLISPSFPKPVCGIDDLKKGIVKHFKNPQRTTTTLKEIKTYPVGERLCLVFCRIEGYQSVYYSRYDFKGWLSRVFIETNDGPKIISEHLSLVE